MKYFLFGVFFIINFAMASDHIDGAVTIKHKQADLADLYAFPNVKDSDRMSIILNSYPIVGKFGHFDQKVQFRIHLNQLEVKNNKFDVISTAVITCKFDTPYLHHNHMGKCSVGNMSAEAKFNVLSRDLGQDIDLFIGKRSDPFFFNANWAKSTSTKGKIPRAENKNIMDHVNVLSIVLDIDMTKLFNLKMGSLYGVYAESITYDSGSSEARIVDRVGRPEITNVTLVSHDDEVDLRDRYNAENTIYLSALNEDDYRERIRKNISYYDNLDGHLDWSVDVKERLVDVLTDDYLVLDLKKSCSADNFLDIEKSIIHDEDYVTCGGRKINDDIMDTLFTYYINQDNGYRVKDGVDRPFKNHDINNFPYLAAPSRGFKAWSKAFLANTALRLGTIWGEIKENF